jgi:hypothetical protein
LTSTAQERRSFAFVDRAELGLQPHFLDLRGTGTLAGEAGPFDVSVLQECLHRPESWKARHRFPTDVSAILLPGPDVSDWRRVVLDRPELLTALLAELEPVRGGGARLAGFAVQPPGWALRREAPLVEFEEGFEEVFPDLAQGPPAQAWAQAWQAWCQPRGLPRAEVEQCRVEYGGHRLRVDAPPRLVERLRAAQSDAVKQEAWLLAGSGPGRAAARIDLHEQASS